MTNEELMQAYPARRIKPVDGMAVTAEVWEQAHDYHRQQLQVHALLSHGSGILTGLSVVASDPPDSSVYVLPGIAVDPAGRTIAITEPVAYDLGNAQGPLQLLLTYGESQPRSDDRQNQDDGVLYTYAEFGIEARQTVSTDHVGVELARLKREGRSSPIVDAQDAAHPGMNEIDMRFRRQVGAQPQEIASIAVSYLGGLKDMRHGRGVSHLARAVSQSDRLQVWVDDNVPLAPGLEDYTLLILVGQDAFQLSPDEMNAIYAYVQSGGTIFMESCRRQTMTGAPKSDASYLDLVKSLGLKLAGLKPGHTLLTEPDLFSTPPAGYETEGAPDMQVGEGVIMSTYDYGCLWQGERRDGNASREAIRSAMEWGGNLVAYALGRRRAARSSKA